MALSLKDPETDRLAREVAKLTGESLTEAVRKSLAERLERERLRRGKPAKGLAEQLNEIAKLARRCPIWIPGLRTKSSDMTKMGCGADGDRYLGDDRLPI
jgi:antitoxin VapB